MLGWARTNAGGPVGVGVNVGTSVSVGVGVMVDEGVGRRVRLGVGVVVADGKIDCVTLGICVEVISLERACCGDSKDGYAKIRKITARIRITRMIRLVSKN